MSPASEPSSPPDVGVLIPAGGSGERAGPGDLKQFRLIAGVPMLLRSIRPFASHPRVRQIVVALPAAHAAQPPAWLREVQGERLRVVPGGETRAESVRAALDALEGDCHIVLVHDAARPFVSVEEIDAVIATADAGRGAVPAVSVADTLKRSPDGSRVEETVARDGLWRALTPQGFPRAMLEAAFAHASAHGGPIGATDDAALVEAAGGAVVLVPGRSENIKLTTTADFAVADALAAR